MGPGFDSLAIVLDLWNEGRFQLGAKGLEIQISGEGADSLPKDESNLIYSSLALAMERAEQKPPTGLRVDCKNRIPLGSGMGSSTAAVLMGLLAGNELAGRPFGKEALLAMAAEIEGHADNAAAALLGGLVLVTGEKDQLRAEELKHSALPCLVFVPEVEISTEEARKALANQVRLEDAVLNIGHAMGLIKAFEAGDIEALRRHMQDRLHQPKRLELISGAAEALAAAQEAGAAAALSGAGPGLIAFIQEGREKAVTEAMRAPFAAKGIATRRYLLATSRMGASLSAEG